MPGMMSWKSCSADFRKQEPKSTVTQDVSIQDGCGVCLRVYSRWKGMTNEHFEVSRMNVCQE